LGVAPDAHATLYPNEVDKVRSKVGRLLTHYPCDVSQVDDGAAQGREAMREWLGDAWNWVGDGPVGFWLLVVVAWVIQIYRWRKGDD